MAIKNHLAKLLGERKMNVQELSRQSGVSGTALYRLFHERNNQISYDTLNAVCKSLNCSVGDFLEHVSDKETN